MITPAALCLLPICLAVVIFRTRALLGRLGKCEYSIPHSRSPLVLLVLVLSPVLIALTWLRKYDGFAVFAVSSAGVFGFTMALREILRGRHTGVYEKGIIWSGNMVFYASVAEYSRIDDSAIVITAPDKTEKILTLSDSALLDRVAATLDSRLQPLQ